MKHSLPSRLVATLFGGVLAAVAPLAAQAQASAWQFEASIYGWFPAVSGTTSFPPNGNGPSVDVSMGDVIDALNSGKLGGYATDVMDEEPPPADHPLLSHPKALITPHIGSRTFESVPRQAMRATLNLVNYLGQKPDVIQANKW